MFVIKRNGDKEPIYFDKITSRIKKLSWELIPNVEPILISQKVCGEIYSGIETFKLDELAAEISASLVTQHPDYGRLAARICVSNIHKNTLKSFSETIEWMHTGNFDENNNVFSLIADDVYEIVMKNAKILNSTII